MPLYDKEVFVNVVGGWRIDDAGLRPPGRSSL